MNTLQVIWNFAATHKAAILFASAMIVRDWKTVKGFRGLKNFFLTGSINPPENQAQPKE